MVTTLKDNWFVGIDVLNGNPYDGYILDQAMEYRTVNGEASFSGKKGDRINAILSGCGFNF